MTENQKAIITVIIIFAGVMGFQLVTNYLPSVMNDKTNATTNQDKVAYKEQLRLKLQDGLDLYLKNNKDKSPKLFSDFISYKDLKPKGSTISLENFPLNSKEVKPVTGIDSKTMVIKYINPNSKKPEDAVFLLNLRYVSLVNL